MAKRSILVAILYVAGKILAILPLIFMICLLALGIAGLVMLFLLSGADWKTFSSLINHDIVDIVYGMLLGMASIVAWIGFSRKKEWARRALIWIAAIYLAVTLLNVVCLAVQGMLVAGHIQNSILHIFYSLCALYFLNRKEIREWLDSQITNAGRVPPVKKENNRSKLSEIIRLAGLVAVFLFMVEYSRHFVRFDIQFEKLIIPLAFIFCFIAYKLFLILKSEEGKDISMGQKKGITFIMGFLWYYLIFLGILCVAIIPSQIRYLNKILSGIASTVSVNHMLEILGTVITIVGALGIFIGGICIITLKDWSRLLVIYSCLGISLEMMYMMIAGWPSSDDIRLFITLVFVLCALPVLFLVSPKIRNQFK